MTFKEEWGEKVLAMWRSEGLSGREISKIIGVGKSTINDFLKPHKHHENADSKILVFDIETAPIKVYTWNLWPNYIPIEMVIEDWTVLTWSAKWLGSDDMMNASVDPASPRDDRALCLKLWDLFDEADIIIAHNGDKFDVTKMNQRWFLLGIHEPSSYRTVDTLKIAKRRFKFTSNKLDYISQISGGPGKVKHEGVSMWVKCLEGDPEALQNMQDYNDGDVVELERIYLKMRGWDDRHPSVAIHGPNDALECPVCGSKEMTSTGRFYHTNVSKFPTYRCGNCKKVSRARSSVKTLDQKKNLVVPTK